VATSRRKALREALETVRKRPDVQLLQTVLLRSLQQARTARERPAIGCVRDYTHFTSPIRAIPTAHPPLDQACSPEAATNPAMADLGAHARKTGAARTRRHARSSWLKCYYMRDRVGEEFEVGFA